MTDPRDIIRALVRGIEGSCGYHGVSDEDLAAAHQWLKERDEYDKRCSDTWLTRDLNDVTITKEVTLPAGDYDEKEIANNDD